MNKLKVCLVLSIMFSSAFVHAHAEDLPEWSSAEPQPNLFVVKTEKHLTYPEADRNLLPTIRKAVAEWAESEFDADCKLIIESLETDQLEALVYMEDGTRQMIVHRHSIPEDNGATESSAADDHYYVGYVRIHVNEAFRDSMERQLTPIHLKRRLKKTLVLAVFICGLLAIVWGYFHTNRLSRGFYVRRIRWIAGALVLVLIFVCYLISRLPS